MAIISKKLFILKPFFYNQSGPLSVISRQYPIFYWFMANHVIVLHNPGAGFEQAQKEEILEALQRKGFEPIYVDINKEGFSDTSQSRGEFVVIAGGDGTLIKMAKYFIGKNIPIGLLPLGTANNIATCLGISGKPADLIATWELNRKRPFSLGVVKGANGETFFLESVGFGLFPRLIRQRMESHDQKETRKEELKDALRHQLQILREYKAHLCTIDLDGQQVSGRFILVEVMNIPYAGPNLNLATHANPEDTYLDIVLVREDEREKIAAYLKNRMKDKGKASPLPVRRAQRIKIEWHGAHYHLDDEPYELPTPIKMEIQVVQKGLEFLAV